jgi:hypothetical protein
LRAIRSHARCAGNPKFEIRNPNRHGEVPSLEFGHRPSSRRAVAPSQRVGFRYSAFGFLCRVTAITHRKDAVYPATIVGVSVKLFLPIFKMNFPEIVDIALPAEGVFHNLVFVSIRKTYPMQAYKIMHGLWGHGADDVHQIPRGGGR